MEKADAEFIAQLTRHHTETLSCIEKANDDLSDRVRALGLTAGYDREEDTLFLTIGAPQDAISPSVDNELFLRVDPETYKIVGAELTHFSEHLRARSPLANFVVDLLQVATITPLRVGPDRDGDRIDLTQDVRVVTAWPASRGPDARAYREANL